MSETIPARVRAIEEATPRIRLFTLVPADASIAFPPFTAGSHISVATSGVERQYSLCNDPLDRGRYVIAVQREDGGRGGSLWMHRHVNVGDTLSIKPPLNNFALVDDAEHHLLIAGGIGITPVIAMTRVIAKQNKSFQTLYLSRSKSETAFLELLTSNAYASHVQIHHDDEAGGIFDLATTLASVPKGTHVYCCGPSGLMAAVESLTKAWPPDRVHFEKFTNDISSHQSGDQPLTVTLARTKLVVEVAADQSILDALLARGLDIDYSCCEGTCGTCVTKLLEGVPDHRDAVLTEAEKDRFIAICCSRAKTKTLVLDL